MAPDYSLLKRVAPAPRCMGATLSHHPISEAGELADAQSRSANHEARLVDAGRVGVSLATMTPTRIATHAYRPKRAPRRRPKAQPAAISGPRIVATKKLGPGLAQE